MTVEQTGIGSHCCHTAPLGGKDKTIDGRKRSPARIKFGAQGQHVRFINERCDKTLILGHVIKGIDGIRQVRVACATGESAGPKSETRRILVGVVIAGQENDIVTGFAFPFAGQRQC